MAENVLTQAERAARRAERREKQRAQNLPRAKAMRALRLQHEREHSRIASPLRAGNFIGCSGWYYWDWRNCFYPRGSSSNQWFKFYAGKFNTVELNAPFYSWPTIQTIKIWRRAAGRKRFVYAIKVNELITHQKRFVGCATLIKDFGLIADLLGPHFGCFLFQLPPSFRYSAAQLKRVLGQLDHSRRNVVEFRHKSWWNTNVFKAFKKTGTIFCSCSGPRLPDELIKTANEIYVRFHGIKQWYRHDYSRDELEIWADRIRKSGANRVWAYFNNDRDCHSIKNARMLMRLLKD
jgi:uncharacterized protein YecE (DUF72 family)